MFSAALPRRMRQGVDMSLVSEHTDKAAKRLFVSAKELVSRDLSIDYLIEDLVARGASGLIFGPSGEGKSFVALDMGLSIATGLRWNGKETDKGIVIYFCGEGHTRIPHRIRAWQIEHGLTASDIELFYSSETTIELRNISAIVNEIQNIAELHQGATVPLIIIDTLSQHYIDDAEENSTRDMRKFLKIVGKIRTHVNCTSLIVHHTGHNNQNRARGASSLKGTLDFECLCNKGILEFTKMKDLETPPNISVSIKSIEVGVQKKTGKRITSAVAVYGKSELAFEKGLRLTEYEQAGVNSLMECLSSGVQSNVSLFSTHFKLWRESFYAEVKKIKPDIKQENLNKQFNRVIKSLPEKGCIRIENQSVILVSSQHLAKIEQSINLINRDIPGHDRDNDLSCLG